MPSTLERILGFANRDLRDVPLLPEDHPTKRFRPYDRYAAFLNTTFGPPPWVLHVSQSPDESLDDAVRLNNAARVFQAEVRLLLRYIARDSAPDDVARAQAVLAEHERCGEVKGDKVPIALLGSDEPSRTRIGLTSFLKAMGKRQEKLEEFRNLWKERVESREKEGHEVADVNFPVTTKTIWQAEHPHAIDYVCDFLRSFVQKSRGAPPIRICPHCGLFFVRNGRRRFCEGHRSEFYRWSREKRRAYQRDQQPKWRATRLSRTELKAWTAKLRRRRMDPIRRRKLLRLLRSELRSRRTPKSK